MTAWRLVRVVAGVLSAAALARADEEHLAIGSIRARVTELQPWIERALDVKLRPFEVRVVTQSELQRIVEGEMRNVYAQLGEAPAAAQALAELHARARCRCLLAKVTADQSAVLICPENIRRMSSLGSEYHRMLDRQFLDVLMLHELVHLAQPKAQNMTGPVARRLEALLVRKAVAEGHAQYVARKVAASRGLTRAFDVLVAVDEGVPSSSTDSDVQEALADALGYAYGQGERFVAAVVGALGEREATQRIFVDPPTHLRAIDRPELYLDPTLDEPCDNDIEKLRESIEELWAERFGKQIQGISSTAAAVKELFAWLGPVEAARAAALVRGGFLVMCSTIRDTHVRVLLCDDTESARDLYGTLGRLLRRRDKRFGNDALFIRDASYSDGHYVSWERSLAFSKRLDTGTTRDRAGMIGLREKLVLECELQEEDASPFMLDRIVWEVTALIDGFEERAPWGNESGEEGLATVRNALGASDPRTRWRAVQQVAGMDITDGRKQAAVLPLLEDKDPNVRAAAVRLLLRAGWSRTATPRSIATLLHDTDPEVASLTIANLSRWEALDQGSRVGAALESLHSSSAEAVLAALEWLSEEGLGSKIEIDHYFALGRHPDPRVRAATLRTLRRSYVRGSVLPDPRLRDVVLVALRAEANCRGEAASILSRVGGNWWDEKMMEALLDGLKDDRGLLAHLTWSAVETAPDTLVKAHAASFEEPLAAVLRSVGAMRALRVLQAHPSLLLPQRAIVTELVHRAGGGTRLEAVLTLHAAGERDEYLMQALLTCLNGPLGFRVADALRDWDPGQIPDSAVPALIEALRSGDEILLRPRAAKALAHIGARAEAALPVLDSLGREKGASSELAEAAGTIRAALDPR